METPRRVPPAQLRIKPLLGLLLGALMLSAVGYYVLKIYEGPTPSEQTEPPSQPLKARAVAEEVLAVSPPPPEARPLENEGEPLLQLREEPAPPPAEAPWHEARARFIEGDQRGAVALAKQCASRLPRCKSGLKNMTEFGRLYEKLEALDEKGLKRLLALDAKITAERGPSKQARNVGTRAASLFYKKASSARAAGQWARAGELAKRTLQADPDHGGAAHLLLEMRGKAREMYLGLFQFCRSEGDPDASLSVLREIVAMTPPEDESHQKAKKWLDQLER